MLTVEAQIDEHGNVRVLQPISIPSPRRALVVILDEPVTPSAPFDDNDDLSEAELEAEDRVWEETFERHADKFAALKAQAKADVAIGKHDDYDRKIKKTFEQARKFFLRRRVFRFLTFAPREPKRERGEDERNGSACAKEDEPVVGESAREIFKKGAFVHAHDARIRHHLFERVIVRERRVTEYTQGDAILAAAPRDERPSPKILVKGIDDLSRFAAANDDQSFGCGGVEFRRHDRIKRNRIRHFATRRVIASRFNEQPRGGRARIRAYERDRLVRHNVDGDDFFLFQIQRERIVQS